MNERVKELRKSMNLTLEKFGNRLGVGKSAIFKIESGENGVTEQMVKLMVIEFGISENWLRTGEGEMFPKFNRTTAIAKLATQIITEKPNSFKSRFISFLVQMTDEQWTFLEKISYNFLRSENYEWTY